MTPLTSKSTLLQVAMLLTHVFKKGNISLQTNGLENIQLQIENNKIDLNFLQKEQLRTLLELEAKMEEEPTLNKLRKLKDIAEKLKQNRLSITVSFKGQRILTLGYGAKPTVSPMITETDAIQINSLLDLMKLAS